MPSSAARLADLLAQTEASARLHAAMAAGTHPDDNYLEPLVARCAVEPDFSVREMLTWALTRLSRGLVLDRVVVELDSPIDQARSQALHTLSKLRDARAWPAITRKHLHDANDEVARTAWRTAVGLAPESEHAALAQELRREIGRGDFEIQRSLARAFVELGASGEVAAQAALVDGNPTVRAHAAAILRLIHDPESTFYLDTNDA